MVNRPQWLKKKIRISDCQTVKGLLREHTVHTVCEQAACPNIGECFRQGVATVMILGTVCTRGCRFCAVDKQGKPEPPDPAEPERIVRMIERLRLQHLVITSVTRDDLPDGGAAVFRDTIAAVRDGLGIVVEVLVPDFRGNPESVRTVMDAQPQIFAHNLETVPRLYPTVRQGADYQRSLAVLRLAWEMTGPAAVKIKSGLMLGLGETEPEVMSVVEDMFSAGCRFLSLGQYLAPSARHAPVIDYIHPDRFAQYKRQALNMGYEHVESGPYVRSSYLADRYLRGVGPAGESAGT